MKQYSSLSWFQQISFVTCALVGLNTRAQVFLFSLEKDCIVHVKFKVTSVSCHPFWQHF